MDRDATRSLDILVEHVQGVRAQQLQHFDALDSKAGILLGFAGAIIALSPGGEPVLLNLGRTAAVLSSFFALATFWPRSFPVTAVFELREHYLASEERFTKLALLDTQIDMARSSRPIIDAKAGRLRVSMVALGVAAGLTAAGVGVR